MQQIEAFADWINYFFLGDVLQTNSQHVAWKMKKQRMEWYNLWCKWRNS